MFVCVNCRRETPTYGDACEACGAGFWTDVNKRGTVVAFLGESDVPCMRCGSVTDTAFRRYRRVLGAGFFDRIYSLAGYFCKDCRGSLFRKHQGLTLLIGWFGLFALLFRNPWAIIVNTRALFGPPGNAAEYGAVSLDAFDEQRRSAFAVPATETSVSYRD